MTLGVVIYEGPSVFDGAPTVAIATGLRGNTVNAKTGSMIQTWIMRSDVSPPEAVQSGQDSSVCGGCIHRVVEGLGTCYVNIGTAPNNIYRAYKAGRYPALNESARRHIAGRHLRLGSYGDPVAVPLRAWDAIRPAHPSLCTGYTHAWRTPEAKPFQSFLMASCEQMAEAEEAMAKGWRPFLVLQHTKPVPSGWAWCPSDALNPGKKVECEDCSLCNGADGYTKPVCIYAHGGRDSGASFRIRERLPVTRKKSTDNKRVLRVSPLVHAELKRRAPSQRKITAYAERMILAGMRAEDEG